MRRAPAAAEPIPVSTMTAPATAAISMGQLSAQSPPAVPTRAHQSGGQPTSRPAHDRVLERAPPNLAMSPRLPRSPGGASSSMMLIVT